mmetsp:Transcript_21189/g.65607  ORF Transcript_21189/g.65607 Transcript_21189/m.65607 type:complete len:282 (+) Transcript_21189:292-1137(+)
MHAQVHHALRRLPQMHFATSAASSHCKRHPSATEKVEERTGKDGREGRACLPLLNHCDACDKVAQGIPPRDDRCPKPKTRNTDDCAQGLDACRELTCNDREDQDRRGLCNERDGRVEPWHSGPVIAAEKDPKACGKASCGDARCGWGGNQGLQAIEVGPGTEDGHAEWGKGRDNPAETVPMEVGRGDQGPTDCIGGPRESPQRQLQQRSIEWKCKTLQHGPRGVRLGAGARLQGCRFNFRTPSVPNQECKVEQVQEGHGGCPGCGDNSVPQEKGQVCQGSQ